MREMIDGMRALHSGMATFQRSIAGTSDARPIDKSEIKPPQSHPIVRLPSGTNQQAIFVNPHFTTEIENVSAEEGSWMLNYRTRLRPNQRISTAISGVWAMS